jgi:hypothetical protein
VWRRAPILPDRLVSGGGDHSCRFRTRRMSSCRWR